MLMATTLRIGQAVKRVPSKVCDWGAAVVSLMLERCLGQFPGHVSHVSDKSRDNQSKLARLFARTEHTALRLLCPELPPCPREQECWPLASRPWRAWWCLPWPMFVQRESGSSLERCVVLAGKSS